jgi:hypothetical protein
LGFRESIRQRQSLAAIAAGVMIVGAGIAIYVQARDLVSSGGGNAFFSTDDGKTYFVEKNTRIPPFDKGGKPAYRAHVFECGGKRVVGYLSRYTPESIKALEQARQYRGTGKPPPNVHLLASIGTTGLQVKRPGEAQWVSQADARRATAVRVYRCPDGTTPQEVEP